MSGMHPHAWLLTKILTGIILVFTELNKRLFKELGVNYIWELDMVVHTVVLAAWDAEPGLLEPRISEPAWVT
jgi:hypothetical protein